MRALSLYPAPLLALTGLLVVACGGTLGTGAGSSNVGTKPSGGIKGNSPDDAFSEDELQTTETGFSTVDVAGDANGTLAPGPGTTTVTQGGGPTTTTLYLPGVGYLSVVATATPKPTATAAATAAATVTATATATAEPSPEPTSPATPGVEVIAAVGYGGYRAVSFDGWTFAVESDRDASNDDFFRFRDVVVAGGRICAVGGGTAVAGSNNMARWASSSDGRAWKEGADPGQWLGGVQYLDGWYVAVGGAGRVLRSRDCESWTETRAADVAKPHMRTLQHKNGVLVAHGDQNAVLSSSDLGATWRSGDGGTGLSSAGKDSVTALGSTVTVELSRLRVARGGQTVNLGSNASPSAVHAGMVGGAAPSPTPTAAPSPSPSPSPSPTPTASPSPSPSPTATVMPTATPVPSQWSDIKSPAYMACQACHGTSKAIKLIFPSDSDTVAAFNARRQASYCAIKAGTMPKPGYPLSAADKTNFLNWLKYGSDLPPGVTFPCD